MDSGAVLPGHATLPPLHARVPSCLFCCACVCVCVWCDEQEGAKFAPEAAFLAKVKAIPGVSSVETQTYTLMPVSVK